MGQTVVRTEVVGYYEEKNQIREMAMYNVIVYEYVVLFRCDLEGTGNWSISCLGHCHFVGYELSM